MSNKKISSLKGAAVKKPVRKKNTSVTINQEEKLNCFALKNYKYLETRLWIFGNSRNIYDHISLCTMSR